MTRQECKPGTRVLYKPLDNKLGTVVRVGIEADYEGQPPKAQVVLDDDDARVHTVFVDELDPLDLQDLKPDPIKILEERLAGIQHELEYLQPRWSEVTQELRSLQRTQRLLALLVIHDHFGSRDKAAPEHARLRRTAQIVLEQEAHGFLEDIIQEEGDGYDETAQKELEELRHGCE